MTGQRIPTLEELTRDPDKYRDIKLPTLEDLSATTSTAIATAIGPDEPVISDAKNHGTSVELDAQASRLSLSSEVTAKAVQASLAETRADKRIWLAATLTLGSLAGILIIGGLFAVYFGRVDLAALQGTVGLITAFLSKFFHTRLGQIDDRLDRRHGDLMILTHVFHLTEVARAIDDTAKRNEELGKLIEWARTVAVENRTSIDQS